MDASAAQAFQLPNFSEIQPDAIGVRIAALIEKLETRLQTLTEQDVSFESLVIGLEEIRHELAREWSPISHLNMVQNNDAFQAAYLKALAEVTRFSTALNQNQSLYEALNALSHGDVELPDPAAAELLRKTLRDFQLAGVALSADQRAQFLELTQTLSALQAEFSNNLQQCTDAWSWHTESEAAIRGLPEPVLCQARSQAVESGLEGWRFALTQPVYQAVTTHCTNRDTRARFYRAWMTRASANGEHDAKFDNSQHIREILSTRHALADLLNFNNYAEFSLAPKMANTVDEVQSFLGDLCERSRATARHQLATLENLAGHRLEPWDVPYYLERQRAHEFAVSDEQLRPYFSLPNVIEGLFGLAARLFDVNFREIDGVDTWHDSVRFIGVFDQSGAPIGGFYTDLFARTGKRGGAWIDECVIRKALPSSSALPVGYLVCNFTAAEADRPAQLAHTELVTLFHEFGHMLHHLLTRVAYPSIAGINGVPWDAVELPSQFLEHYAWHYDVLRQCSGHVETGEALPRALFDRLYASRNCGAGLQMLRQLEFAIFDFSLHARSDAAGDGVLQQVLSDTRSNTSMVDVPVWNRFENGFSHIFAGGYAAGYYSYKWAEVLAADAFSAFEESGNIFDAHTASRFREDILEIGGSEDIGAAFTRFRGRAASIDALLIRDGITAA